MTCSSSKSRMLYCRTKFAGSAISCIKYWKQDFVEKKMVVSWELSWENFGCNTAKLEICRNSLDFLTSRTSPSGMCLSWITFYTGTWCLTEMTVSCTLSDALNRSPSSAEEWCPSSTFSVTSTANFHTAVQILPRCQAGREATSMRSTNGCSCLEGASKWLWCRTELGLVIPPGSNGGS